jgi:hypothetical protein
MVLDFTQHGIISVMILQSVFSFSQKEPAPVKQFFERYFIRRLQREGSDKDMEILIQVFQEVMVLRVMAPSRPPAKDGIHHPKAHNAKPKRRGGLETRPGVDRN